jgi:hypothetical protein
MFALMVVATLQNVPAAQAETYNAVVQCGTVGPAYNATLETELDLAKWEPSEKCKPLNNNVGAVRKFKSPGFDLKFKGLDYIPLQKEVTVAFSDLSCSVRSPVIGFDQWFMLVEKRSGFVFGGSVGRTSTGFQIFDGKGELPKNYTYASRTDTCTIRVLDQ